MKPLLGTKKGRTSARLVLPRGMGFDLTGDEGLGGTSKLCATYVADVGPSVAPPKIVAEVGCPVQYERVSSLNAGRIGAQYETVSQSRFLSALPLVAANIRPAIRSGLPANSGGYPLWTSARRRVASIASASTARHCARMRSAVKQVFFRTIFCGRLTCARRAKLSALRA